MIRIPRTAIVLLGFFFPWAVAGCDSAPGDPRFTIRRMRMAGDELRVILETSSTHRPLLSHSSKTSNAKGWLITVDLSKGGPIESRSRLIGPLWDVPNERSSLSFDSGPMFTKADAAARGPRRSSIWRGMAPSSGFRAQPNGATARSFANTWSLTPSPAGRKTVLFFRFLRRDHQ